MKLLLLLLLSITISCFQGDSQPELNLIMVNGKYGYIDQDGKEVIPPTFHAAGEFSEGLAPVRKEGLYGYINTKGEFVIPPQFEFALPFKNRFAIVYTSGHPSFINPEGKQPFPTPFKEINNYVNGRAEVVTHTGKHGFINTSGKLIIDTSFSEIRPFVDGLAVVEGTEHEKEKFKKNVGVIDTLGQLVVPYGRFDDIMDYKEGYAYFDIGEKEGDEVGETAQGGFIDKQGNIVMSRYNKNNSWIQGNLSNGLARISLYKHWIPESKGTLWSSKNSYEGYINLKGDIVFSDTTVVNSTEFSHGRAFVAGKVGNYYLIDTTGKRVSTKSFTRISGNGFVKGLALVQSDSKWGLINTEGEFVVEPKFKHIDEPLLNDKYFAFIEYVKDPNGVLHPRYGIASLDGSILIKPILKDYSRRGFAGGLLLGWLDESIVYFDSLGKEVWRSLKEQEGSLRKLNIDFMNRGYFYADQIEKYRSNNEQAKPTKTNNQTAIQNFNEAIIIRIDTLKTVAFENKYKGYALSVTNVMGQPITFNAQDSRLYLKLQALNSNGEWKDIEYLPNSWCGNSYHTINLSPQQGWEFVIPQYEGAITTKLRAELRFIDPNDLTKENLKKEIIIYSNIINSSVNPAQFWRKPDYYPRGLMDPYNE